MKLTLPSLFEDWPLVVAYGMGVDSTAMLIAMARRGIRPDLILFADTGGEKDETYNFRPVMDQYLRDQGFPTIQVVKNVVSDFKNWPPYDSLEENCLTNGTLPSEAFNFGSCSEKWKQAPQHRFCRAWAPAVQCWDIGGRLLKAIGYDAGPKDSKRRWNHEGDRHYEYWHPLVELGWDRARCQKEIARAGLPVPPKSSCFYCPNMRPAEVAALPADKLRRIVVMEARAKPRLKTIGGLWRKGCKGTRGAEAFPPSITEFIVAEGLLSAAEVGQLVAEVPVAIVRDQERHTAGEAIVPWSEFFAKLGRVSA